MGAWWSWWKIWKSEWKNSTRTRCFGKKWYKLVGDNIGSYWGWYPPCEVAKNSRPHAWSIVLLPKHVCVPFFDLSPMSSENQTLHTTLNWILNTEYNTKIWLYILLEIQTEKCLTNKLICTLFLTRYWSSNTSLKSNCTYYWKSKLKNAWPTSLFAHSYLLQKCWNEYSIKWC